jgi:hypothetical protein
MQLFRIEQRMATLAGSLGSELKPPNHGAFLTKEAAERMGNELGLFEN